MSLVIFKTTLTKGHQVASGQANDSRFLKGTIFIQSPYFKELGLDISMYYPATLNLDLSPKSLNISHPKLTFENVNWHPQVPSETFSFTPCVLQIMADKNRHINQSTNLNNKTSVSKSYRALIYYPHQETKFEHHQAPNVIEVLAPFIENIKYGSEIRLFVEKKYLSLIL